MFRVVNYAGVLDVETASPQRLMVVSQELHPQNGILIGKRSVTNDNRRGWNL